MKINLLYLVLLCSGCSTTISNNEVKIPPEPDYPIYQVKATDSNSVKAKAVVSSWRDCIDYNQQLTNLLRAN